jgi:hypothetical protein
MKQMLALSPAIKHAYPAAFLADCYFKLRTSGLKKVIFTATTGRSGTLTLARLFSAVPGCLSLHEPYPIMNAEILQAASFGDFATSEQVYRRIKSINIRRASVGHRYYFEANHLFIKTFIEHAAQDFGDRLEVIHLVRPPIEVAMSIYRLSDYPGTEMGNRWWLDFRAPLNRIQIADVLDRDDEFSHPFYKALWYWFEIEARVQEWQARLPNVPFHRFETEWLNDRQRIFELMDKLKMPYVASDLAPHVGTKEHARDHHKQVAAIPPDQAQRMLERFKELLAQRQAAGMLRLPAL